MCACRWPGADRVCACRWPGADRVCACRWPDADRVCACRWPGADRVCACVLAGADRVCACRWPDADRVCACRWRGGDRDAPAVPHVGGRVPASPRALHGGAGGGPSLAPPAALRRARVLVRQAGSRVRLPRPAGRRPADRQRRRRRCAAAVVRQRSTASAVCSRGLLAVGVLEVDGVPGHFVASSLQQDFANRFR